MNTKSLLIVAPHPDDDILGCGGLMHKISKSGGKIHVLILNVENKSRIKEAKNALSLLPNHATLDIFGNYKKGLDGLLIKKIASWIEKMIDKYQPEIFVFPNESAYHQDHKIAGNASIIASRPSGGTKRFRPNIIMSYETVSDCWPPNNQLAGQISFELTQEDIDFKLMAMAQHISQNRNFPSERSLDSIKILASLRGSQCGVSYAENYNVYRILEKV